MNIGSIAVLNHHKGIAIYDQHTPQHILCRQGLASQQIVDWARRTPVMNIDGENVQINSKPVWCQGKPVEESQDIQDASGEWEMTDILKAAAMRGYIGDITALHTTTNNLFNTLTTEHFCNSLQGIIAHFGVSQPNLIYNYIPIFLFRRNRNTNKPINNATSSS